MQLSMSRGEHRTINIRRRRHAPSSPISIWKIDFPIRTQSAVLLPAATETGGMLQSWEWDSYVTGGERHRYSAATETIKHKHLHITKRGTQGDSNVTRRERETRTPQLQRQIERFYCTWFWARKAEGLQCYERDTRELYSIDKYYLVSGRGTKKDSSVTEIERETGYQVAPCRERAAERL
jgi:hypothetical protein